ncbi:hypothetical protein J010_01638 [Cryptococcus neoformans]|uniref:Uncharacterized protein n=1 Tax=Cryptococcus neoformans Tu259-1 TaxID=1230072 RepID=A0A854QH00_CRYNE|nr:hypothetical protein C368_02494 [Cryptococcus neoformans var. grubii 125.91]OXG25701.1 hypothetical protein C361_01661 [Cryptococcus neoformans var. grubii Tu259-1]OXG37943.1 hypothetical protein C360_01700 [Cryptococcus neoformans var. grubii Bt15]OXG52481.1 hypothetical protein C355_01766 [Cryptococcus neoformans var. grubii Th84]OXH15541.1 hypothetical protein J010_01638 [Cryptococcus neoformans var. grubii]
MAPLRPEKPPVVLILGGTSTVARAIAVVARRSRVRNA